MEAETKSRLAALKQTLAQLRGLFDVDAKLADLALVEAKMAAPDFWNNPDSAQRSIKELKALKAVVDPLEDYSRRTQDLEELLELAEEENDVETVAEVTRDLAPIEEELEKFSLTAMLSGEFDSCDAFVMIHAGAGGTDSCDWVSMLLRMYSRWLENRKFKASIIESLEGDEAGLKSVTLDVKGPLAYGYLKTEIGIHRLVRISPFDSAARRHTSFASVDVAPQLNDADLEIELDEKELRVDTYRSSGAGGQHVNVTDSAVRITHLPTSIVASCQNERSQHQNRAVAMRVLKARLYARRLEERQAELAALSGAKTEIAWGNQRRNYVLQPYTMVKDLATGVETGDVSRVLDGDLDPFVDAFLRMKMGQESPDAPMNPLELRQIDPQIFGALRDELRRELTGIELIAAENYVSEAVLVAQGSVMTNKYAEGYPGRRYYGGCEYIDVPERLAIERVKEIFGADHANVQPHSGSQANMAVYFSILEPGDRILSLDLAHGGHLSHGAKRNFTGALYEIIRYGVSRDTEVLDMDIIRASAQEHRPQLIVTGASAYPRFIDFEAFADIAREVGAMLMCDIAHIAGLIAAGLHPSPVPHSDFVTATTHKTMRGPRGGIIMCKKKHAKKIDSQVFPGIQGGPLMHTIAGKAVALQEALLPDFHEYQAQILRNCQAMLKELQSRGYRIVSGGSDNHLFLVDLQHFDTMTGLQACELLDEAGITVNQNLIPFDPRSARETSGIRIGTPAVTTRGMHEPEMVQIADWIDQVLRSPDDAALRRRIRDEVEQFCLQFPIYPGLSGTFLPELLERVGT